MADFIDRAALLADMEGTLVFSGRPGDSGFQNANKIIDRIKAAPAVDAEPVKHGQWIFHVVGFEGDSDSYWASSPIDVTVLAESEKEAIKKAEAVTGRKLSGRNRNIIVIERAVFELKENA